MRPIRKQAANLSVRGDLLQAARKAGLNLSAVLEEALLERLAATKREAWIKENSDSIEAYNQLVSDAGVFSDSSRTF